MIFTDTSIRNGINAISMSKGRNKIKITFPMWPSRPQEDSNLFSNFVSLKLSGADSRERIDKSTRAGLVKN